jgi:NADH dehydrogenase
MLKIMTEKISSAGRKNNFLTTVLWAAGIKGNIPGGVDNSLLPGNRIKVDRQNRVTVLKYICDQGPCIYGNT